MRKRCGSSLCLCLIFYSVTSSRPIRPLIGSGAVSRPQVYSLSVSLLIVVLASYLGEGNTGNGFIPIITSTKGVPAGNPSPPPLITDPSLGHGWLSETCNFRFWKERLRGRKQTRIPRPVGSVPARQNQIVRLLQLTLYRL